MGRGGRAVPGGNTPTSVGKTPLPISTGLIPWKHPHERGEDLPIYSSLPGLLETPPRAWGRPPLYGLDVEGIGNTPTSVGKTPSGLASSRTNKKHPHERGEDLTPLECERLQGETPPRAWGRQAGKADAGAVDRNTPTSVGKTDEAVASGAMALKHPHERGEDSGKALASPSLIETPPRAWGRPAITRQSSSLPGNTPTSVGKTVFSSLLAALR